jgi:hypothetical protein
MIQNEKINERRILIRRLFYSDRDYYKIGKSAKIVWFDKFDEKFGKDVYAYFADDEKKEAIDKITKDPSDTEFIHATNTVFKEKERYLDIDTFVGQYYYFDKDSGIVLENITKFLKEQIKKALDDTRERGYYFLKALIQLHKGDKWDKAYGGATWVDILAKTRELKGPYPSPRDLVMLKSYKIYFKTGSRRYPTHTLPEEMISIIDEVLAEIKDKMMTAK